MTPRALAVMPTVAGARPRYDCTACAAQWGYRDVRHVLCCPECGGGLWRRDVPARGDEPPQRSGRSG